MPTAEELKQRLFFLVDDTLDDEEVLDLFNQALEDLSPVAAYARTVKTNSDTDDLLLPHDLISIVSLEIKLESKDSFVRLADLRIRHEKDIYNEDYRLDGTYGYAIFGDVIEIKPFPKERFDLKLRYYAELPPLTKMEDTPALKTHYHKLLPLFAASRYMQNWQNALPERNDYYQEYLAGKQELEQEMRWRKNRTKSRVVHQFRKWV